MIGHLRGRVLVATPERVVLDAAGVGYEVQVPLGTLARLERLDEGAEASLWIHTHVREDALALFGFSTTTEKETFLRLVAVSGIGPRLALTVLSGLSPAELRQAVESGDVARLQGIPGIGRKTSERLVVELRDRLASLPIDDDEGAARPATEDELVTALVGLGYRRPSAEKALAKVRRESPDLQAADQLRAALRALSRL